MSERMVTGNELLGVKDVWMCSTDFYHELGEVSGGTEIYMSREDLIRSRDCINENELACEALRVRVTLDE